MASLLSLQYPNGRAHELAVPEDLQVGSEFDRFGHRWKVVAPKTRGRSSWGRGLELEQRLVCLQVAARPGAGESAELPRRAGRATTHAR